MPDYRFFFWDSRYATGCDLVDVQHQKLMSLVNVLAEGILKSSDAQQLELIFNELIHYTDYHFHYEEDFFQHSTLTPNELALHKASHNDFIRRVLEAKRAIVQKTLGGEYYSAALEFLAYLIKWLVVHILVDDKHLIYSLKHAVHKSFDSVADIGPRFDSVDVLVESLIKAQVSISHICRERSNSPESKFRLLAENSLDVYLLFNFNGELVWFNQAFTTLCTTSGEEAPEPTCVMARLHRSNGQSVASLVTEVIQHPQLLRQHTLFLQTSLADGGEELEFHSKWQLVFGKDGAVDGVFAVLEDVTEKSRQHRRLQLFRAALDQASDAMLIVDPLSSQIIDVNQPIARMLGYSSAELKALSIKELNLGLSADSRWRRHVQQVYRHGSLTFRDRQRCKDGTLLHVEVLVRKVSFESVFYLVGIVRDISRQVYIERKGRFRNRTLSRFLSRYTSPDQVLTMLVCELGRWLLEMGMPLNRLILSDYIHLKQHVQNHSGQRAVSSRILTVAKPAMDDGTRHSEAYIHCCLGGMTSYSFPCLSSGQHHADIQLELNAPDHMLSQNEVCAINTAIQLARVILDKYQVEQALRQREAQAAFEARHDSLTGLANRLRLFEYVPRALERARRRQQKIAFVYVDIDHFKTINDCYGHAAGDKVLLCFSRLLRQGVRHRDLVCRLSGDEFLIVMEEFTDTTQVSQLMDKLQRQLAVDIPVDDEATIRIASSMGIAFYPDDHDTLDGVIRCADEAMYLVKQRGRSAWGRYADVIPSSLLTDDLGGKR